MINLPIKAISLNGNDNNEKIELIITEVFDFPVRTSIEGGYDFKGSLEICVGSYSVRCSEFYSSTGILYNFLTTLQKCYDSFNGTAYYRHIYENDLNFSLTMTNFGHAIIKGLFREVPHLENELIFEIETDQTCILEAITCLKKVRDIFGDSKGIHTE